jgi:hypothetical protein
VFWLKNPGEADAVCKAVVRFGGNLNGVGIGFGRTQKEPERFFELSAKVLSPAGGSCAKKGMHSAR